MSTTIQRNYYRSGQLREEAHFKNGRQHGVRRVWHKNGALAEEEPYQNGLPHGVSRQWNDKGKLLGRYRMVHGTGVRRQWHDNGRLQAEISEVVGGFCGPSRLWLRDGTLISEQFHLDGTTISAARYAAARKVNPKLPKFRGSGILMRADSLALRRRIHRLFVGWLLHRPNQREAAEWLAPKEWKSSLGRFKREVGARKLVAELYEAGARKVIVPDIYRNPARDEFADGLLVQLPKDAKKREAVRVVCARLQSKGLGALEPAEELGERHLYLAMA